MLIDCSYFTSGTRHILNATSGEGALPNPNSTQVNATIEAYIAELQEEYLTATLGGSVGNKLNAYLVCLDEDEEPKHVESLDVVCDRMREPFADYVFFHILRDINTQTTVTGLVMLKCANTYVAPIRRQVTAWNAMVDKHRLFREWCVSDECSVKGIETGAAMLTKINVLNL